MAKNNKKDTNKKTNPVVDAKIVANEQKQKQSTFKKAASVAWTVTKVTVSTVALVAAAGFSAAVLYGMADELDRRAQFEKNEHEYYREKIGFHTRYFNRNGRDVTAEIKAAIKSGEIRKEDIGGKEG